MPAFPILTYSLSVLESRWTPELKKELSMTYEEEVRKMAKMICLAIEFELGGIESQEQATRITKCLWTELKHIESLDTADTILTILKEFSERFLTSEKGRAEAMRLIDGEYEVESDSENSDCDSLCSSCDASEKKERDGWHRMRMAIREMAGPKGRRTGVAIKKKIGKGLIRRLH